MQLETDDESYHGGLLQDEIAALISLSLGIRLKAGDHSRDYPNPSDGRRQIRRFARKMIQSSGQV